MRVENGFWGRGLRALAAVLLVVTTAGAGLAWARTTIIAGAEPAGVIPDTGGPISRLALHYVLFSAADLAPTYADLFQALPPDVALQILCPSAEDVDEFWLRWGSAACAGGRSVQVINVNQPITVWARDRCIARQSTTSGDPAITIVPAGNLDYDEDKYAELIVPHLLAAAGVISETQAIKLHLEGGNIVSNSRHAFVGANVFHENAHRFGDECDIEEELAEVLGRPCLVLSDDADQVPWLHVDMYVTPVDETTVLVASPALALTLLASDFCGAEGADGEEPCPKATEILLTGSDALDSIADQLAESGYRVLRLPALLDPQEEWMITYNNVLMECRAGERIVYLPAYRFPVLDSVAASVYRSLGFQVRSIDVSRIYRYGGAVRCLANVTGRQASTAAGRTSTSNTIGNLDLEEAATTGTLTRVPATKQRLSGAFRNAVVFGARAVQRHVLSMITDKADMNAGFRLPVEAVNKHKAAPADRNDRRWRMPPPGRPQHASVMRHQVVVESSG